MGLASWSLLAGAEVGEAHEDLDESATPDETADDEETDLEEESESKAPDGTSDDEETPEKESDSEHKPRGPSATHGASLTARRMTRFESASEPRSSQGGLPCGARV